MIHVLTILITYYMHTYSVYAVKTRKLPDNFNESKLIFLHVMATSFLWMAFLPTYFSAVDAIQKTSLLAMFLLISSTLALLCLHMPKVMYDHRLLVKHICRYT